MKKYPAQKVAFISLFFILLTPFVIPGITSAADQKTTIYDFAQLLSEQQIGDLEALSKELGAERETDFVILTTKDTEGKDVVRYMQDFYDENVLGYDQPHGNTAILTIDMQHREVYLAGFYKAKKYLDDVRVNQIRNKISPYLSSEDYFQASKLFIETAHHYMGYRPGVNPENILFKGWFQLIVALAVAGVVVSVMAYHSEGRVTVNDRTYLDTNQSRVIEKKDEYIRTSVTKTKKPSSNNNGGGGGFTGGGFTGGGHSHSGSRGRF